MQNTIEYSALFFDSSRNEYKRGTVDVIICIHRSFIVPVNRIEKYTKNWVTLKELIYNVKSFYMYCKIILQLIFYYIL